MDGIHFAEGFDAPDRLAFGLSAPQLITVVAGCLLAFALLHTPIPAALAIPVAVVAAAVAAALGWLRVAGRPALEWTVFAARHLMGPRHGVLLVVADPRLHDAPPAVPSAHIARVARRRAIQTAVTLAPVSMARAAAPKILRLPGPTSQPLVTNTAGGRRGARRVVFFSLKGGTGRTTLSTEIAAWAATCHAGGETVLVDCDLRSACVGARLGIAGPGITDFAIAHPEERRVDEFLVTHATGLRLLLGPSRATNPDWPVTPLVLREVWRELDLAGASVVVIDVAPEMNHLTVAALRAADDIYVVIVPTATGIHDAYRTTEQLRRLGLRDRLRYVVNRADGRVDMSVAMGDLGGQLVSEIPEDAAFVEAENTHRPAVLTGSGATAFELRRLARLVAPVAYAAAR